MTELIAFLSTGKGTWGHVSRLLNSEDWEAVYLFTNEYGAQNFTPDKDTVKLIKIDEYKGIRELEEEILEQLKAHVKGSEVAINFVSGAGKEHMALMGALMKMGVGFRLMAITQDGMREL